MYRWLGLLVALLAAGCGAGAGQAPSASAPPASITPAGSPASAALTLAEAKTRYLEIVGSYNTALEALEDAANAGRPWTDVRRLAGAVSIANAAHGRALRESAWPAEVREPMAALLAEIEAAQPHWERAGKATTAGELGDAIRAAVEHSGTEPAAKIRDILGLPPYRES